MQLRAIAPGDRYLRARPIEERICMARPRGDYAARRRQVVLATCRLIARSGVEAATVRAVAHELGVATKAVTRYFRSKEELLLLVLDYIIEEQIRFSTRHQGSADDGSTLIRMLATALPTTAPVRTGWRIWVAFLGQAVGNPALQRHHRQRYDRLRTLLLEWLTHFAESGAVPEAAATRASADYLLALIDGIGVREAVNPRSIPASRQRELLARAVASVVGESGS
jgi:AcrR family transcriptional regulator